LIHSGRAGSIPAPGTNKQHKFQISGIRPTFLQFDNQKSPQPETRPLTSAGRILMKKAGFEK
jgi:hypothetical protein